ncbi:hypothetical protein AB0M47_29160 [Hamadaea sp. NPDC051192]|uniref:hypothetical protein n=1 Tax=Hamadaea sp. NPDC051192 TaxID=3154940 RepID=UPI00341845D9
MTAEPSLQPIHLEILVATFVDTDEVSAIKLSDDSARDDHMIQFALPAASRPDVLGYEVVNAEGRAAFEPVTSWRLSGRDLYLEYLPRAAEMLGFPQIQHLRLSIPDADLAELTRLLPQVVWDACYLVD